jgi:CHAD domain-containing protein
MPYRLQLDRPVATEIRRIAGERIDLAIEQAESGELELADAVHEVRKRCKEIRAVLRLVRPQFNATYRHENAWYRDAARKLSPLRDAYMMVEACDKLSATATDVAAEKVDDLFVSVRDLLVSRRNEILNHTDAESCVREFVQAMKRGRKRVSDWTIAARGFAAVEGGFRKTYARGRMAMKKAYAEPTPENFHQWRKRVKYHWYHTRLLRDIWPAVLGARSNELHSLSSVLGSEHDLALLHDALRNSTAVQADPAAIQAFCTMIADRQAALRQEAASLGKPLFAEKPRELTAHLGACWP